MADVIYKCPQCGATLKPAQAIAPGKKIKCPKCQNIFAPTGGAPPVAAAAASKPAPAKPKPVMEEEEGAGTYGFRDDPAPAAKATLPIHDDEPALDDEPKKKKKKAAEEAEEDLLAKKYPKSKKGAAQAICQKPTNQMLMTSSFACFSCLISALMAVWTIVFYKERVWSVDLMGVPLNRIVLLVLCVAAFVYNGVIALGAVKIQSMESASLGMIGALLCAIPLSWAFAIPAYAWWFKLIDSILGPENFFVWIGLAVISLWYVYIGLWNLKTLRDPDVVAAFAEPKAKYED